MVLRTHSAHTTPAGTGQGGLIRQDKISFKEVLWWLGLLHLCPVKMGPVLKADQTKSLLQTPPKGPGANLLFQFTLPSAHQNNAMDKTGIPQLVCAPKKVNQDLQNHPWLKACKGEARL